MHGLVGLARAAAIGLPVLLAVNTAQAQSASELAAEIEALKQDYEERITALEAQLAKSQAAEETPAPAARPSAATHDTSFNPEIGVVLNGMLSDYSAEASGFPGFQQGHESGRPDEGFALGHSEISFSGNIDDKFRGGLTLGLGVHAGEPVELELEEAYVQTLPGAGLPEGFRLKAGRALWTFGYLNELHAHGDDFSDRPLPYRAYLDGAYNDDGAEFALVIPGNLYQEIGAGFFRGGDTPFGGSESGREAFSAYARLGGDIGRSGAWRIGAYLLAGHARNRTGGAHAHGEEAHGHEEALGHEEEEHAHEEEDDAHEEEEHHALEEDDHAHEEDEEEHAHAEGAGHDHSEFFSEGAFTGDTQLYGIDFRVTVAPSGNARESELILQGEYFLRRESGSYMLEEEAEQLTGDSHGWYAQAIYKFLPQWRVGARYSQLTPPDDAELDDDLSAFSAMVDWTNSEFGRVRFQYNREMLGEETDDQFILQYVTSLGAHGAHSF